MAVDAGLRRSGLRITPANVQDVTVATDLVPPDGGRVYADRGYDAAGFRAELAACGCGDGVMRRARRRRR